jgi:hypothetical protein
MASLKFDFPIVDVWANPTGVGHLFPEEDEKNTLLISRPDGYSGGRAAL